MLPVDVDVFEDITQTRTWPCRPDATAGGARALYLHQTAGTLLWAGGGTVEALDRTRVRAVLLDAATHPDLAAEERGEYPP